MNKDDIREIINKLNTEEEIIDFVKKRLSFLEENSEEKMLGQNYTDSFRDYISSKAHFKPADRFSDRECADLVFDDITPYIEIIKIMKQNNGLSNNLSDMYYINQMINEYLPANENSIESIESRFQVYYNDKASIKDIKNKHCGECSERAGLAQNIFKFLGMDSEFVGGYINNEPHAYNLFYPKGYENDPVLIYDTAERIVFKNDENKQKVFPMFKVLSRDEANDLKSGKPIELDLTASEQICIKAYGDWLSGYQIVGDNPTYTLGLDNSYTNNCSR